MTIPIRSMAGLVEALRERRDTLDISNETIDAIAGLPERYSAKLLAPRAPRNMSYNSLGLLLGALGIGLQIVEDPEQAAKVRGRWSKRKPQGPRYQSIFTADAPSSSTSSSISNRMREIRKLVKKENLVKAGKNGGKRRAKSMAKRARQAQATHAARKRWEKQE